MIDRFESRAALRRRRRRSDGRRRQRFLGHLMMTRVGRRQMSSAMMQF